jgi:hypothetical protein
MARNLGVIGPAPNAGVLIRRAPNLAVGSWFDHLEIDDQTRAKIGWENAEQLLRL